MKNSSRLRYPNGLVLRLRLTPHFMGCFSPVLSEIADEYADVLKVAKVNVDDEPELAMKFKVSSIPMLVLFKKGKIISTSVGYRPKDEILNELKLYKNQM